MRNKFNYNELVKVSGIGKNYGIVKNKLGFIIEKDKYYNDYCVDLIFGRKDWYEEKFIERVLGTKKNKAQKYQIRLCTSEKGYNLIEQNIKANMPISNNKMRQVTLYKNFKKRKMTYIVLGWNSVFWPKSNKSVIILENTIDTFRKLNIPFQYIVMNEENLLDIKIKEFLENDSNVSVFVIERKIKSKKK